MDRGFKPSPRCCSLGLCQSGAKEDWQSIVGLHHHLQASLHKLIGGNKDFIQSGDLVLAVQGAGVNSDLVSQHISLVALQFLMPRFGIFLPCEREGNTDASVGLFEQMPAHQHRIIGSFDARFLPTCVRFSFFDSHSPPHQCLAFKHSMEVPETHKQIAQSKQQNKQVIASFWEIHKRCRLQGTDLIWSLAVLKHRPKLIHALRLEGVLVDVRFWPEPMRDNRGDIGYCDPTIASVLMAQSDPLGALVPDVVDGEGLPTTCNRQIHASDSDRGIVRDMGRYQIERETHTHTLTHAHTSQRQR